MKNTLVALILIIQFCAVQSAFGAVLPGASDECAGMPGAFLRFGSSARSLGMGKAFTAVADDAGAAYFNPAGLAVIREKELITMYSALYENTVYGYLGYVHPLNAGSVGISIVSLASQGFQLRDEYNNPAGETGAGENAAIFSYSGMFSKKLPGLSHGINLKLVQQSVCDKSGTGFGLDAGLLWKPVSQKFSAGVCIQNIIPPGIKLAETWETYPLNTSLGLSYRLFGDKLLLSSDIVRVKNGLLKCRLGSELNLENLIMFRAGLNENEAAAGFGFKLGNYEVDYAFACHLTGADFNDLGNSHRFGLKIVF